jgi:uncharacterized protein (TIGR03000 family)
MLPRAAVVAAAVAVLTAAVAVRPARADGYGPYDQDGGRWYADEQRDQERLGFDAYGTGRVRTARPFYRVTTGAYYALPASGYYAGAPTYGPMPSANYSYGAYSPSTAENTARIRLVVPTGAKVWFGSSATKQTGSVRDFESPRLTPGKEYTYDIKATWSEGGKEVTRTRQVDVRANSNSTVDFTRQ